MMIRKFSVIFFLVLACSLQTLARDDDELQDDEIFMEYEASGTNEMFPGDDEDMEGESGSGYIEDEIPDLATTTTMIDENFEEEPEITVGNTLPPRVKVAPQPEEVDIIPDDVEMNVTPKETPSKDTDENHSKGEEDVDVDVNVNLEEDKKDDLFSGSSSFIVIIVGVCIGVVFAMCVIALLVYRLRKKDEGSYALEESKRLTSSPDIQYSSGQEYYA